MSIRAFVIQFSRIKMFPVWCNNPLSASDQKPHLTFWQTREALYCLERLHSSPNLKIKTSLSVINQPWIVRTDLKGWYCGKFSNLECYLCCIKHSESNAMVILCSWLSWQAGPVALLDTASVSKFVTKFYDSAPADTKCTWNLINICTYPSNSLCSFDYYWVLAWLRLTMNIWCIHKGNHWSLTLRELLHRIWNILSHETWIARTPHLTENRNIELNLFYMILVCAFLMQLSVVENCGHFIWEGFFRR